MISRKTSPNLNKIPLGCLSPLTNTRDKDESGAICMIYLPTNARFVPSIPVEVTRARPQYEALKDLWSSEATNPATFKQLRSSLLFICRNYKLCKSMHNTLSLSSAYDFPLSCLIDYETKGDSEKKLLCFAAWKTVDPTWVKTAKSFGYHWAG